MGSDDAEDKHDNDEGKVEKKRKRKRKKSVASRALEAAVADEAVRGALRPRLRPIKTIVAVAACGGQRLQ